MTARRIHLALVFTTVCVVLATATCSPTAPADRPGPGNANGQPNDNGSTNTNGQAGDNDQGNASDQTNANDSPNDNAQANTYDSPDTPAERSDVDTHAHLDMFYLSDEPGAGWVMDAGGAVATALSVMDTAGVDLALLMPPPYTRAKTLEPFAYDYTALAAVVADYPDRFVLVAGGAVLNPIIEETAAGAVTQEIKDDFRAKAEAIVDAGAVGLGEFAALHFSFFEDHPFIEVSPDHPLFLLLADIAAEHGLPVDIHMEAVAADDTPLSSEFTDPNPPTVDENLTAFATLLAHNREAKIVWSHVGWDDIGDMTVERLRSLMTEHSNLYLNIKVLGAPGRQVEANRPVDATGTIRAEWVDLITDFDDRVLLGADEFYGIAGETPDRPVSTQATWDFVNQLPDDLAAKVAGGNARRIFNLSE